VSDKVHFGIRTPKTLRDLVEEAAHRRGLSASEWAREKLRQGAAQELAGEPWSRQHARTRGTEGER
jgi:hypothetical protein